VLHAARTRAMSCGSLATAMLQRVCAASDGSGSHGYVGNGRIFLGSSLSTWADCQSACEAQGVAGCCEGRTGVRCNFRQAPLGIIQVSSGHTDTRAVMCGDSTSALTKAPPPPSPSPPNLAPPPPSPLPPLPSDSSGSLLTVISGSYYCHATGHNCVSDGAGTYTNGEACTVRVNAPATVTATAFSTEGRYDYLLIHDERYSGTSGPENVGMGTGDTITWYTDGSVVRGGFTLCAAAGTAGAVAAPPPPSPSPPSAAPPPPSPSPPPPTRGGNFSCGNGCAPNSLSDSSDGICDDGGPGSEYSRYVPQPHTHGRRCEPPPPWPPSLTSPSLSLSLHERGHTATGPIIALFLPHSAALWPLALSL